MQLSLTSQPQDADDFLQRGKVLIARHQGCVLFLGQRGCETVGVWQMMPDPKGRREFGRLGIRVNDVNRKLRDLLQNLFCHSQAPIPPDDVIDLSPIDEANEGSNLARSRLLDQSLNPSCTGAVLQQDQECVSVEDETP